MRTATGEQAQAQAVIERSLALPLKTLTNGTGMEFVLIPAGSFLMGSPEGEGHDDEHPQHQVAITQAFYLGKYPVTQAQWQAVCWASTSDHGQWPEKTGPHELLPE